jgi:glycerol-3-phosphate dehydrogenase (NAD(P)+)
MPEMISVIGDGAMGTLCAVMLAQNGARVRLWSAFPQNAAEMAQLRENRHFLPGLAIPNSIEITGDDKLALAGADLAVSAVPTQFIRRVWDRLRSYAGKGLPICSVAKGVENKTLLRPSQVLADALDGSAGSKRPLAVLSGPCIAPEVARQLPASVTVASADASLAARVQQAFSRPYFRVYTNPDVIGTELAGATKNVIAIAAGMLDGLGAGDNAKAALLTRGLVEITRLGLAMGAKAETFAGLAGMGDLVTTCISPVGRNRSFGEAVGKGKTVKEALAATESVVEGVATTTSVVELAQRHQIEMPLTQGVYDVLFNGVRAADALTALMARPLKRES